MINVLINGITGKMGNEVLQEALKAEDIQVVAGVNNSKILLNYNIPVYNDFASVKEAVDVVVDFSSPQGAMKALDYAIEKKIPIVIATTGFDEEQELKINQYSRYIPIFKSSNMSYEVNVMCEVVSMLAKKFYDSDIEIIETHHRNKMDSPSGTALMLANTINETLYNEMEYVYDRHKQRKRRGKKEIGISSVRGGTEAGRHTVLFLGENESFEITHNVTSRNVFARGAIKAIRFMINKQPGMYDMHSL